MSGMLPVGFGGSASAYEIAKSVRFRASASAYLSRTPASAGNRRTWTWSGWIKRGTLAVNTFFGAANGTNAQTYLGFANNALEFVEWDGALKTYMTTTPIYRDPSAWMHVVLSYDNPQATSTNRLSLYVNGVKVTAFTNSTYPVQNYDGAVNATMSHAIGREELADNSHFDGYLSEINFVDGQALSATSFGEFDVNDVWQPKRYSGTYGTNGFYLPFNDGTTLTDLCLDRSGNANNWTANNISLTAGVNYDWVDDTPTNNFCVLNPLNTSTQHAYSSANLLATLSSASDPRFAKGSVFVSSGKWVAEYKPVVAASVGSCGVGDAAAGTSGGGLPTANSVVYFGNGVIYRNGVSQGTFTSFTNANTIRIELDMGALTCAFYRDGTLVTTITGLTSGAYTFGGFANNVSDSFAFNFGQQPWQGGMPSSGFKALSTKNLPTGTSITTSGTFTGNASADGPFVWLNGNPSTMTINGNAITFGTHADKTAGGFKVRTASTFYNATGSNTYSVSVTGKLFGDSSRAPNTAQGNP